MAAASKDLQSPAQNCAQLSRLFEAQERVKLLNYITVGNTKTLVGWVSRDNATPAEIRISL